MHIHKWPVLMFVVQNFLKLIEQAINRKLVLFDVSFIHKKTNHNLILFLFQTLNTISAEKNSTIVFPLPVDMITYFMRASEARIN